MMDDRLDNILKISMDQEIKDEELFMYRDAMSGRRTKTIKLIGTVAAAAVLTMALGIGVIVAVSPALAAKIPLIGRIFAETEDNITFSGTYDKADVLTSENDDGIISTNEYTAEDQGYTLTASEVYCDGYSIYLTVDIRSQDNDLTEVSIIQTKNDGVTTSAMMNAPLVWSLFNSYGELIGSYNELNGNILGRIIDEHEFIGMIKLNIPELLDEDNYMADIRFYGIGYDESVIPDSPEAAKKQEYRTAGNWNIKVPVSIDPDVRTFTLNEGTEAILLKSVTISDYQVIVHTETDFDANNYYPVSTIVYDQNGEKLQGDDQNAEAGIEVFAVQGKELTSIDIYVFEGIDGVDKWFEAYKGGNTEVLQQADIHAEVTLR